MQQKGGKSVFKEANQNWPGMLTLWKRKNVM
jgi:hypothetical protein